MNKRTITSIITGILILLISITIITYAYFASQITNNAIVDIETGFDIGAISFIASGTDNLAMQLSHADLMQVQEDEVAKTVSSDVNISLLANSTNTVRCTYDIVWNWVETATPANRYTKTPGAIKEFTVFGSDGTNNISERQVPNYTGGNLSTIIYSGIITNNSTTIPTSQTWEMSANFYNLAILQDAVATGNYISTITVESIDCVPLPVDFTQNYELLEYIQSTGTQHIETGIQGNSDTSAFEVVTDTSGLTQIVDYPCIIGARTSSNQDRLYHIISYNTVWYGGNGTSEGSVTGSYQGRYTWTYNTNNDKKYRYANVELGSVSQSFTSPTLWLLNCHYTSGQQNRHLLAKLYSTKIWNNGVLVRHMIPAKRNSDNVVGMYDIVNKVFYENAGSGTFLYN